MEQEEAEGASSAEEAEAEAGQDHTSEVECQVPSLQLSSILTTTAFKSIII